MHSIFIAAKDEESVRVIQECFPTSHVDVARDAKTLLRNLGKRPYNTALIDLDILLEAAPAEARSQDRQLDDMDRHHSPLLALQRIQRRCGTARILVMTPQNRIRMAVEVVKAGAGDYLTYPLRKAEVTHAEETLRKSARMKSELKYLRKRAGEATSTLVEPDSAVMQSVLDKIHMVADTKTLVLLTGESGTGKSLIARHIHNLSPRVKKPFISVHCGAIPDTLIESELFGHERGAFTGAIKTKLGKFEIAHGGTLFLDEIATISHAAQVKLLQILQEKTFQRVGGETTREADVRIIAATNRDLQTMAGNDEFREDLYYRLNVFPIEIPPLRERPEDIPSLILHFLEQLRAEYPKDIVDVHPLVLDALTTYSWPGNVRELQNVVERAYILEKSQVLSLDSFPKDLINSGAPEACIRLDTEVPLAEFRERAKEVAENMYLRQVMAMYQGKINQTAAHANISTRQLRKLLARYDINKAEYK